MAEFVRTVEFYEISCCGHRVRGDVYCVHELDIQIEKFVQIINFNNVSDGQPVHEIT